MSVFPVDVTDLLRTRLAKDRRPPDGLLHPSGDLIGSLRHSMLRAAGAPTIESDVVSDTRLMTGTLWHSFFESIFGASRLPIMTEVRLDRWLPEGWSGTADWIVWNGEPYPHGGFVLGDLKTIKGEGMKFVEYEGIKAEHMWQLSSYWYALEAMGVPLVKGFAVYYLPQNAPMGENVKPSLQEGVPLDRELVLGTMRDRWALTQAYLASIEAGPHDLLQDPNYYVTDLLAPEQERIQRLGLVRKEAKWEVKLSPHWSAQFCPYEEALCNCRAQGVTKIGEYKLALDGPAVVYEPRKGYEELVPEVEPSEAEIAKLWREFNPDGA